MPLPPRVISAWLGDIAAAAAASEPENQTRRVSSPSARQKQRPCVQDPQPRPPKRRALQEYSDAHITTPAVKAEPGVSARKRLRPQAQALQQQRPSRRRALHETTANMPRLSPPDSPDPLNSPEREPRQPSHQPSGRSGRTAGSRKASAGPQQPQNVERERRPRGRPRNARGQKPLAVASGRVTSIEATGNLVLSPSTSQYSESRYGDELASMEHVVNEPAKSNATTSPSRKGKSKSRNPSPVKSLDDMHIFDKPISVGFVNEERPIPEVLRPHWDALEDICANIGIIPRSIEVRHLQGNAMVILTACRHSSKKKNGCVLPCYPRHRYLHRAKALGSKIATSRTCVRCGTPR
ncbi:hypothetical protein BU26DRAFT_177708 [Trematosphaeria pertusa]|uniref:Uncharacterized protein n=1 Tax=Trematosphaeria pertusa TaxID=390896 RepID=A0A6A6HTS0_9PLEO|nr:uncharacterized protein BU26DRAFT_177708 [Trematosphaeria pertusa]KAF2241411.1 hypothetical protein BU26DRAFT_177708 [Trematosphaeria pertusa]